MEDRSELTALKYRAQVIRIQEMIFDFTKELSRLQKDLDTFDRGLNLPLAKLRNTPAF